MKKRLIIIMLVFALCLSCLMACKKEPEPVSLKITAQPTKLSYILGEELKLDGGKFCIEYSNGKLGEEISMTAAGVGHNFDKTKLGVQTVEISYQSLKGTIDVTVEEDPKVVRIRTLTSQLLDGVKNLTPATIGSASTKIVASYTLLDSIKGDDDFEDILASVKAEMPSYISILFEHFFLAGDTAKVTYLKALLPEDIKDIFAAIQTKVDAVLDLEGVDFLLGYADVLKLIDDAVATGFASFEGTAAALAGEATTLYEDDYYFDELADEVFFDLYIAYLRVEKADSGADYAQTEAFKTKMDALFELFYEADFATQTLLKTLTDSFGDYYEAFFYTYVDAVSTDMTWYILVARQDLAQMFAPEPDFGAIMQAYYSVSACEENFYFNKNIGGKMHANVAKEFESLVGTDMYQLLKVYGAFNKLNNEYTIWFDNMRDYFIESGMNEPFDVNRKAAQADYLEAQFLVEYASNTQLMALYNDLIVPFRDQVLLSIENDVHFVYYDYFDWEFMGWTANVYAELSLKSYCMNSGSPEYIALLDEYVDDIRQIAQEFWQYMSVVDEGGLVVGQAYSSLTDAVELFRMYGEYYIFIDNEPAALAFSEYMYRLFGSYNKHNADGHYNLEFLRVAYEILDLFDTLNATEKLNFNLGLEGEPLIVFLQDIFDEYNDYDIFVFEAGAELLKITQAIMATSTEDQARFVLEYLRVAELFATYDPALIDVINQLWISSNWMPLFEEYTNLYAEVMYPYIADNDAGVSEQEIEQFMTAFFALADIKMTYESEISEISHLLSIGQAPNQQMLSTVSQKAVDFMAILGALPFVMQEKLVSQAISNVSLVGNAYKNLAYIYAYNTLSANNMDYQFARLIISLDDNYISFMAQNERMGAGADPLENAYYYRLYEIYDINNVIEFYEENIKGKLGFEGSLIGAMYNRQSAAVLALPSQPSARFVEMVDLYREVSRAYELSSLNYDMTYYVAKLAELEAFLAVMRDDTLEGYNASDEAMFNNSIIMIEIVDAVGYYQYYTSTTKLWVVADTPDVLLASLFYGVFSAELWQTAGNYYMDEQNSKALMDQYLAIASLYLLDDDTDFMAIDEGDILGLISTLNTIDATIAEGFMNIFPMYMDIIVDYYSDTLSQKQQYVLANFLLAQAMQIVYNKEIAKLEEYLIDDPYGNLDYQRDYVVPAAVQAFLVKAFVAHNLYIMLDNEPSVGNILRDTADSVMTLCIYLLQDDEGEQFSLALHNIAVLLINARMAANDGSGYNFMVVFTLAQKAIDALSGTDLEDYASKVYIEADPNDGEPAFTIEDMYQLVLQIKQSQAIFEYVSSEGKALIAAYEPIAWEIWLGAFSTADISGDIQNIVDKTAAFAENSEWYDFNNVMNNHLGGASFLDVLYGHAMNNFQFSDPAFGVASFMIQALSYLQNYQFAGFVNALNQAQIIYSEIDDDTQFVAVFGALYQAMLSYYPVIASML